jgi:hypothetical protein
MLEHDKRFEEREEQRSGAGTPTLAPHFMEWYRDVQMQAGGTDLFLVLSSPAGMA